MNTTQSPQLPLLDAGCRRGVLVATSVRYWRGCKRLNPEDLGLDPANVSDRLIQLGHKRIIPRDALSDFALIESRVQATVEAASFPFLGGIGRYVPNPRLGDLKDKLDKLHDEVQKAMSDFAFGYPTALSWGRTNQTRHAAFQAMWLQYDHLPPHARGGDNGLDNVIITCAPCNCARVNYTVAEVGRRSGDPGGQGGS